MSASRTEIVDPGMTDRVWTRITRTLIDTGRPPDRGPRVPRQARAQLPITRPPSTLRACPVM